MAKDDEYVLVIEWASGKASVFSSRRGKWVRNDRAVFCKIICADQNCIQAIGNRPEVGLRLVLYVWENKKWEISYISREIEEVVISEDE